MVTSVLAGQLVTRTGKYRIFPILGGVFMAIAMFLLTNLGPHTSRLESALYYVVLGLGMGFLMQMTSLISQNSVELRDMGVASSARMFFQQIGGSLGVAAFGALFASRLNASMSTAATGGAHVQVSGGSFDPAQVMSLPPAVRNIVFGAISHSVDGVFWAVGPAMIAVVILALFIKEVPLRGRTAPSPETPAPEMDLVA
jgi:MFS family permease